MMDPLKTAEGVGPLQTVKGVSGPAAEETVLEAVLPPAEEIEQAACDYARGAELSRQGDALKRRARKVLQAVPDGRYGCATVTRKPNSPITDKAAMECRLKALGEDVPMMERAASLVVELTEAPTVSTEGIAVVPLVEPPVSWVDEIFAAARPAALAA
ncbi:MULTISPECIES: hypothetical protein [Streptomyces]|uniref:hypothetical protein n=1 Tax=Streptomyces TaxID=1883 RepID=UPI00345B77C0